MIYVFSNLEFGKDFLAVVRKLCLRHPSPSITIVLSGKRGWPKHPLRSFGQRLNWPIKKWRTARGLSRRMGTAVMVCDDVNASFSKRVRPEDDGVIAGFNQIFKADLISRFHSIVNCHPSLLPFYRGPVPSFWCIRNGEVFSGYTFHRVTEVIDDGGILWQEVVEIRSDDTPATLNARIAARAAGTFERYLLSLLEGNRFGARSVNAATVYKHHVDYKSFPAE